MVYYLSHFLQSYASLFNVVHYVSFRTMAALLTTLFMSIGFGGWFIRYFGDFMRAKAREWTPENHRQKDNMPTMGGIFILAVVFVNSMLWCDLSYPSVWFFLACLLGFGFIGFTDDLAKIKKRRGIAAGTKFALQFLVAACIALGLYLGNIVEPTIVFPVFKSIQPNLGPIFVLWAMFILIGVSNAVNLTDGLDGLAMNALVPNFATFSIINYLAGHCILASYLMIPFAHSSEIAVIGGILVGASLGFLWFNTYPAQIFMGDVGSLALGSALGLMALLCKQELLLVISGGLFVIETASVIVQVLSFKFLKRRIFRMAPIHHHFELLGWPESQITVRFGIISLVLCLLALMSLKVR